MDKLSEVVINYLKMKSTGALFITGDWGSGKTFHIKNKVFAKIEEYTDRIPVIVSLFGESDKNNIGQRVMFAYLDKKGKEAKLSTGTIAKNLKHLADSFPKIKDYVDLEKLAIGTGENLFRILPHNKLVIVFDDLERMGESLPVDEFLGIVNDLVENNGCKVILIANEAEIKDGIAFKEKTIEKTFHFVPDVEDVFNSIIKSYEKSPFRDFVNDHTEFFIKSIDISAFNNINLRKSYSNIRTLKFAVEHFKYVFLLFPQKLENFNNPLIIAQLKNLWYFIVAVSIEFRKPNNITYSSRKSLDTPPLNSLDFDIFNNIDYEALSQDLDDIKTEDHSAYFEKFKKIYYTRFNEQYIYHDAVYDLITGGMEIERKEFREHMEKSFNVKDGEIPEGHRILNKIQQEGYWSFSNDEFVNALNELLEYCETGKLNDLLSYLNSGVFILGFKDLIEKSSDDIVSRITKGVDIFFEKEKLSSGVVQQWEMVGYQFEKSEDLQKIVKHVGAKIVELETKKSEEEAKRIEKMFETDIESFLQEFSSDTTGVVSAGKAFLHNFKPEIVYSAVEGWGPKAIKHVDLFLKKRYLETAFPGRLIKEITFLENLKLGIEKLDLEKKSLSNFLIKTNLVPRIDECLAALIIDPTDFNA